MKRIYYLTIYWIEEKGYDKDVVKSKYVKFDTFQEAAKKGIQLLSEPENKDMWADITVYD